MSNARIIEIPATRQIRSGKNNTMRKMRVAAYCRVSTEEEEQQGSFETQKLYYTEKINSTSEWELAGIYADDGISGIHTKKRDGFNQMIQDCKKKKIDLILTKSISRFARNTLDSIQYVRMLKAIGIAVIFEKENINTSTMNSEMILTVLSAFAQAESESISQNVARGKRMGFRQGKFPFPYGQILGYRKGLDGKPEVIPEEAEVIRMIFNSYLQGASLLTIKKKLEAGGVLTARGNKKWSSESVQRILQNEKYCGDVLLQKTFIEDVLTGVSKKNTGQLPQYYIENNHEGIVTKQMFREVQAEIARRNSKSAANQRKRHQGRYNSKYALSERLVCGDCGSPYKRVTWNIHGRKQIVWRCVNRLEYGTKFCSHSPSIPEEELHQAVVPSKTVNSGRCNAGKNCKKCFHVRDRCICIAHILQLHRPSRLQHRRGQCSPATRDVCSNGKAPRADTESAPTVQGTMFVIPNKSLKQKIPEQTFEDFGADEGI